jgi:cell division protein FtsQ
MRARRLLAWGLSGGIAVLVLWTAGDRIAHGETFQVSEVQFEGQHEASPAQLRHLSDIRMGTHMFQADLNRAVHGVERHPWVESASARRRFPGTVEITVREHTPEILVALDKLWYADSRGHVFKRADSRRLDFPILTGLDPEVLEAHPALGRRIILETFSVLKVLTEQSTVDPAELSEVHFDSHRGFTLVLRNGSRVVLGFEAPREKLDRLAQMVAVGLDLTQPQVVDLDIGTVAVATPLPN